MIGGAPLPRHGEGRQVALGASAHGTRKGEANAGRGRQLHLPLLHKLERGDAVRMLDVHSQQRLGEIGG